MLHNLCATFDWIHPDASTGGISVMHLPMLSLVAEACMAGHRFWSIHQRSIDGRMLEASSP